MIAPALRRHAGLLALLAVAAPLTVAFCWHGVISSLGDDSMSYIVVARWLVPFAHDDLSAPWVGYYSHFPPLFPLLLGVTGGAWNFFSAHMVVAACAVAALASIYAYGLRRLGGAGSALGLVVLFLALPTAWISIVGILSEPLYLAVSMAALAFHARADVARDTRASVIFAVLVAATLLTRVAGVALVAACAVHVAVGSMKARRWPSGRELLPLAVAVAVELAWLAIRPHVASKGYGLDVWTFMNRWIDHPLLLAGISANFLAGGWTSSIDADSGVPFAIQAALWAVALLGLAGAVRGAMRNRLDSWYLLFGVGILFLWVFSEDNTRRLLYPLVPLMLVHAAEMAADAGERLGGARGKRWALLVGAAFIVSLSAPATSLVARKAFDREPLVEGLEYSPSSMTDYYIVVNLKAAKALAWRHAAVLSGLQLVDKVTPRDAVVMWLRPEYVAVLGRRRGEPSYSSWDRATLSREILRNGVTHVVSSRMFKSDLADRGGDAYAALMVDLPESLRHPALMIQNAETGSVELAVLEVDREALQREVGPKR
ncbi:MAG TPA: hypothetical protein VKR38_06060 [Usitatibacter sp.]|nr:hypothetical protein [Usitatibacter sp.]